MYVQKAEHKPEPPKRSDIYANMEGYKPSSRKFNTENVEWYWRSPIIYIKPDGTTEVGWLLKSTTDSIITEFVFRGPEYGEQGKTERRIFTYAELNAGVLKLAERI